MEETASGDTSDVEAFDESVWPLCGPLKSVDGCWLVPHVPDAVIIAALATYLHLGDDELLLAVLDGGTEQRPEPGCALTTKRLHWACDPHHKADPAPDRMPRAESLAYRDLPPSLAINGSARKVLDLGNDRRIRLEGKTKALEALATLLPELRARAVGDDALPEIPWAARDQARWSWAEIVQYNRDARTLQAQIRTRQAALRAFQARTSLAAQGIVTNVLAAACVLVFVAMVLAGVSPIEPATNAVLAWGANYGPAVVFDGQAWRLLTCQFLHFGIIHLALNVWCLRSVGPVVERFFGHPGFAALYLLSGLGGAFASLLFHPFGVCAGASGAIFGVVGGLLAFLVARRGDFPAGLLKRMRSSTLAFVGSNIIFGMMFPMIDMAGHLGGLVSGFIVGLCLCPRPMARPDTVGRLRRLGVIVALVLVFAGFSRPVLRAARTQIEVELEAARAE